MTGFAARAGEAAPPLLDGRIVRAHGHIFYVRAAGGVWQCRPRGRLRPPPRPAAASRRGSAAPASRRPTLLAGDLVRVRPLADSEGVIEQVLPRRTELARPPVANVDQALVVFTLVDPPFDPHHLDRVLALAESHDLDALLVLNKIDLAPPEAVERTAALYRSIGYRVFPTCARTGEGVERLRAPLAGRFSVFAGQSGVGKSCLLNAIEPGLALRTGEVSRKLGRGRHTTRHVELLELKHVPGATVADTPGFSQLELDGVPAEGLQHCLPEFPAVAAACRFQGCLHRAEPGCAVRAAVERGVIARSRYQSYLAILGDILSPRRR